MGRELTFLPLLVAASLTNLVECLTPAEWRSQSIYQVMTDRFARTDLSTTASCSTSAQVYCGGTWQGLISELDYIQGMGFTAIWISPMVAQMSGDTSDGEAYHVSKYSFMISLSHLYLHSKKKRKGCGDSLAMTCPDPDSLYTAWNKVQKHG